MTKWKKLRDRMDILTTMHPREYRVGRVEIGLVTDGRIWASIRAVEIKDGSMLTGAVGFGTDHKKAIRALWERLSKAEHVVLDAMGRDRLSVRWSAQHKRWHRISEETNA